MGTPEVTSCFALKTLYLGQAIFNAAIFGRLHVNRNKQTNEALRKCDLFISRAVIQLASPQASCPMLAGSHLKPQIGGKMAEANRSLHHAQPRARMGAAVMTPARSEQRRGSRNSSELRD